MALISIEDDEPRKYKINACLLAYTICEYRRAIRDIPKRMGISLNTFHNYRNILINDPQDIPHERVVMLEQIFGLPKGELLNKIIVLAPLKDTL